MTLALIRHGQTDWNLARLMQGSSDIPLNDTGREQVRGAAEALAGQPPATGSWDAVVSSPLSRARETGRIIAERLGIELGPSYAEFAEAHFGDAEGTPVDEVLHRWPGWDITNAEPFPEVGPRGLRGLELVLAEFGEHANVIVAAHGTLIRATLATILDRDPRGLPHIENGTASTLDFGGDAWSVLTVGGVELGVELEPEEVEDAADAAESVDAAAGSRA